MTQLYNIKLVLALLSMATVVSYPLSKGDSFEVTPNTMRLVHPGSSNWPVYRSSSANMLCWLVHTSAAILLHPGSS